MKVAQSLQTQEEDGAGVRIPKEMVGLQDNFSVLTPIAKAKKHSLELLLQDVTPDQIDGEFDWGNDVGTERYE